MAFPVRRDICNSDDCDKTPVPGYLVAYLEHRGDETTILGLFHFYCAEHLDMALDPAYRAIVRDVSPQIEVVVYGPCAAG